MKEIEKNEKLAHLSDEKIENLINKYYSGVKTTDLIEEYKINATPSTLYKLFPPIICEEMLCPVCNMPMFKNRTSKSCYGRINTNKAYCKKCGHKDDSFCRCSFCEEKRKFELEKRQKEKKLEYERKSFLINQVYNLSKYEPVKISEISFKDRIYLGALLRTSLSEDMMSIESLSSVERNLAPTSEFTKEILSELHKKNIIVVSPESGVDAFVDSDEETEFPYVYYVYKVKYALNVKFENSYKEGIASILNPTQLLEKDKEETLEVWRRVALEECIEYLKYQMDSVRFDFNIGEKTIVTLKDLLEDFSVSQIYGIIYKSIANATKYYQESSISRKQAANSVVGGCSRYAEKAIVGKWDLTKYSRIKDLPQSVISEFLFNRVIKIGNLGFDMPPVEL